MKLRDFIYLFILISCIGFANALTLQNVVLDSDNSNINIYFQYGYNQSNVFVQIDDIPFEYKSLFSGSSYNIPKYPMVDNNKIYLPSGNFENYKLTISYLDLDIYSKNPKISFYSNSKLLFSFNISSFKFQNSNYNLDLNNPISSKVICTFNNNTLNNCNLDKTKILVKSNSNISIEIPFYINSTKISKVSNISFKIDPNSKVISSFNIGGSLLKNNIGFISNSLLDYNNGRIYAYLLDNLSNILYSSPNIYSLNDYGVGNFSTKNNSIIYITDNNVGLLTESSNSNILNNGGFKINKFISYSSASNYFYSDKDVFDFEKLNSSTNFTYILNSSWVSLDSNNKCAVLFNVNKVGSISNFNVIINGNLYSVPTSSIVNNNYHISTSYNSNYNDLISLNKNNISFSNPMIKYLAKDCKLTLGAGFIGDVSSKNVTLSINGINYSMDKSNLNQINSNSFSYLNSYSNLPDSSINTQNNHLISFKNQWDTSNYSSCSLSLGLNYIGSNKKLILSFGEKNYSLDTSDIISGNAIFDTFKAQSSRGIIPLSKGDALFNFNKSNLNANLCDLTFGANYKGDKSNLKLNISTQSNSYLVNLSALNKNNLISSTYPSQSWIQNSSLSIGISNSVDQSDLFEITTNNLFDNLDSFGNCNIKLNLCYKSSGTANKLDVYFNSKSHLINSSDISSCDSGFTDYILPVECSDLSTKPNLDLTCVDCDSNNYFKIGLTSTSGGVSNSYLQNSTNVTFTSDLGKDPLIELVSSKSLDYNLLHLEIPCLDLENKNITFTCTNCNNNNDINLISESSNIKTITYQNSLKLNKSLSVGISTNSSYNYSVISTNFLCSDLNSNINYIDLTCTDCDSNNYFNFPLFNLSMNSITLFNSTFYSGVPKLNIVSFDRLDNSYLSLNTLCSNLNGDLYYKLYCDNCSSSDSIILFNDLNSNQGTLKVNNILTPGNLLFDVYSNNSLIGSPLSLSNLDCSLLNDSLEISCPSCNSSNYLNFLKVNGSSLHSKYSDGTFIQNDLNILVQKYSKLPGDSFAIIDDSGQLKVYDTNSNLLWYKSIGGFGYRNIYVADLFSNKLGLEIVYANSSQINIYDSFGNLLNSLNGFNNPKFISSQNLLFVVNKDFSYSIIDSGNIVKSSKLNNVGFEFVKLLETNLINSTEEKEYLLISKDFQNTYFTLFDNQFNVISSSSYPGNFIDFDYSSKYPTSILIMGSNSLDVYKYNILNGFSIKLNNSNIYDYPNSISSKFETDDLSESFNNYLSSLSNLTFGNILLPLKFIFNNLNSASVSFKMFFNSNISDVVSYSNYNNLVSTNKLIVGNEYPINGVNISYKDVLFPIKVRTISNLPNYTGGKFFLYNHNKKLIGTCSNSFGTIADLGYYNLFGSKIGCGLGYTINGGRLNDYIMYSNLTKILDSNSLFQSSLLNDKKIYSIYVNSTFVQNNFTNIFYSFDGFSNNTPYDKILLNYNDSINVHNLNYKISNSCYNDVVSIENDDDIVENILENNYALTNISGNLIYVCAIDLDNDGKPDSFATLISKLKGTNLVSFQVQGDINSRIILSNIKSSSNQVMWNQEFYIQGNFLDLNGDYANITLQFLNPISLNWTNYTSKYYASSNGIFNFTNIKLDSSFIGNDIYYRFISSDLNSTNPNIIFGSKISNLNSINIEKIPLNITKYDSGNTPLIEYLVKDNLTGSLLSQVLCKLYLKVNSDFVLYLTSFTNSSGICSFDISQLNPNSYEHYIIGEKDYYLNTQSIISTQTFKYIPDLLISLNSSYNITHPLSISARLIDDNNNLLFDSAICNLYINNKLLSSAPTNSSTGICQFSPDLLNQNGYSPVDFSVGINNLQINISNLDPNKFVVTKFVKHYNLSLIDTPQITVLSPFSSTNFDPSDTINLSISIKDSFSNDIPINNSFYWEYEETSTGDKSIISSKLNDTWKIPSDVYGAVDLKAVFNDDNYGGKTVVTIPISVKDGLKIHSLTNSKLLRLPNQINKLEANLVTGNNIPVNESDYNGTWSGYNCSWSLVNGVSKIILGNSTTDSNGYCSFNFKTNCSYSIQDYNLTVDLYGDFNAPKYSVLSNHTKVQLNLYDDLSNGSFSINPLSSTNFSDDMFYGSEYNLKYNIIDSCGVPLNKSLFDLEWFYKSDILNLKSSLGIKDDLVFTPLSYMDGNSFIVAKILPNKYYNSSEIKENISIIKIANINYFNVPKYLIKNAVNNITCGISIPGILNKSIYSAIISIDGVNHNIGLTYSGEAKYSWDTTGISEGQHVVTCKINNLIQNSYSIVVGNYNLSSKVSNMPSNLLIYNSSVLMSNRDYYLAKSSAGNPVMPSGLNQNMVFRKGFNPFYEPEIMYFGISYATIGASGTINANKQILLDGVNVTGYIYNNDSNSLITTLNCIQNLDEFNNREAVDPKDVVDNYRTKYVCLMQFNPNNIPVGIYKIIINATMPGQSGWTSETYTNYFQVWGILNSTITAPASNDLIVVNNDYNFKSTVKDEFGTSLDSSQAQVEYKLRDASWNCGAVSIGTTSLAGSDSQFTYTNKLSNVNGGYITNDDRTYHYWKIQTRAFAQYYKTNSILTAYDPMPHNLCDYQYLNQLFITENHFRPQYPAIASFVYPTGPVMAPDVDGDNAGKLSFACKLRNFDGKAIRYVPITLSCDGCYSIPNGYETKSTDSTGYAYFAYSPNSTDYDNQYNFTCLVNPYSYGNGGKIVSQSNQKKAITIVQELGSGWGDLPANYTPPKFSKYGIFTDDQCSNKVTWLKSNSANSVDFYVGFSVGGGSANLTHYSISYNKLASDAGDDPTFGTTPDVKEDDLNGDSNSVSKCTKVTANVKSGGIYKYAFNIEVTDNAGGGNNRNGILAYVDDVAPVIKNLITTPYYVKPNYPVIFTANMEPTSVDVDGYPDMSEVGISTDSTYSTKLGKTSEALWTITINSPSTEDTYNYNIKAIDKAGYYDTKSNAATIIVDGTNPAISTDDLNTGCTDPHVLASSCINSATSFQLTGNDNNLLESAKISGTGSIGVVVSKINISNSDYDSGQITKDLSSISDGSYTITYELDDKAGNKNITQITLIKKTTYPTMSVVANPEYINSKGQNVNLVGPIFEVSGYNVSSVKIDGLDPTNSCSNLPTNSCDLNEDVDTNNFNEGDNIINLTSSDNYDNTGTKLIHVVLDTINPTISISNPSDNDYIKGSFDIKVNADDANINANTKVLYSLGSCSGEMSYNPGDNTAQITIPDSSTCGYGLKDLKVNITDLAGNIGEDSISVTIDNTLPIVKILAPEKDEVVEGNTNLNLSLEDDYKDKLDYKFDLGNYNELDSNSPGCTENGNILNCLISYDTSSLSDGEHTIYLKGNDSAGNIGTNFSTFIVDNNPPTITITKIKNTMNENEFTSNFNGTLIGGIFEIHFEVEDEAGQGNDSTYKCLIGSDSYDSSLVLGNEYECDINSSKYSEGANIITVSANDTLNHNSIKKINLTFDNTPPIANLYYVTKHLMKSNDTFDYFLNASEKIVGKCVVEITEQTGTLVNKLNETAISTTTTNCSNNNIKLDVSKDKNGIYLITTLFTDVVGYTSEVNTSFMLDNNAPLITYFNLTNAAPPALATNNAPGIGPMDNLSWIANISENLGFGNISFVKIHPISGINVNTSKYELLKNISEKTFVLSNYSIAHFSNGNPVENDTYFELIVGDLVGNIRNESFHFYVSNKPPEIYDLIKDKENVEVNVGSIALTSNVSGSPVKVNKVEIIVTSPNGSIYSKEFTFSPVQDVTNTFEFSPTLSGQYNVTVIATNTGGKSSEQVFENAFTAIGTTTASLNYSPTSELIPYSYFGNSSKFNISFNLTNTGQARMLNSIVSFASSSGFIVTPSTYNCGVINASNKCSGNVIVIVENNVGFGSKILKLFVDWNNVDNSADSLTYNLPIDVKESNKLVILNNNLENLNLEKTLNENLGSIQIRNNGNNKLSNIKFNVINGTINDSAILVSFTPDTISNININDISIVNINITSTKKGNFQGYIGANASCISSECYKSIFTNVSFYDKVKQDITTPNNNQEIIRGNYPNGLPLNCTISSNYDNNFLINHPTKLFLDDGSKIELTQLNSDNNGKISYNVNLTTITPGKVSLICEGQNDLSNYIKSSNYGNNKVNITLKGSLTGSIGFNYPTSCIGSLYWYDSHPCNNVNITANVLDEFNYPVPSTNVTFYSNATNTSNTQILGSCTTDLTGNCEINWNPSVEVQGVYDVYANFSKNIYYSNYSTKKNITIKGGILVQIISPTNSTLKYNNTYNFDLMIKDTAGNDITDTLDYNTSWSLINSSGYVSNLSINKTFNMTINNSFIGNYLLNLTIVSNNGTYSDIDSVSIIRDSLNLTANSDYMDLFRDTDNTTVDRTSINLSVNAFDMAINKNMSNVSITFKLDNNQIIGNCLTNIEGNCNIVWNPSIAIQAGYHNISIYSNKSFYTEKNTSINNVLLKVYIQPHWISASTYSDNMNNDYTVPLMCEILQFNTTLNPLDKFRVDFQKLTPGLFNDVLITENPIINNSQYIFNSTNANLTNLGLNVGLKINYTDSTNITIYSGSTPVDDLHLTDFNYVRVEFTNLTTGSMWYLYGLNESSGLELIGNSTDKVKIIQISHNKVYNNIILKIENTGSNWAILKNIHFYETQNQKIINLGQPEVMGIQLTGIDAPKYFGNFENLYPGTGFSSFGTKITEFTSSTDFSFDKAKSLKISFDSLNPGESFGFVWNPTNYNIKDYTQLLFAGLNLDNVSLNIKVKFETLGQSYTYDLGNFTHKFTYPNINLSEYKLNTGANSINNISVIFTNNGDSAITDSIYLDRFEFLKKESTSSLGYAKIDFHPYDPGYYRFACNISSNYRYIVKTNRQEKVIKIINSGAASDQGVQVGGASNSQGAAASNGAVISFEPSIIEGDYIVPKNGLGVLDNLEIFNALSLDRHFNISSDSNGVLSFGKKLLSSAILDLSGDNIKSNSIVVNLNTTNTTEQMLDMNIFITDISTKEKISIPIHFTIVSFNVTSPFTISNTTNLMPGQQLNVDTNIEYNSSSSATELNMFNYKLLLSKTKNIYDCDNNLHNIASGLINLKCNLPFILTNSSVDLTLRTDFGGDN